MSPVATPHRTAPSFGDSRGSPPLVPTHLQRAVSHQGGFEHEVGVPQVAVLEEEPLAAVLGQLPEEKRRERHEDEEGEQRDEDHQEKVGQGRRLLQGFFSWWRGKDGWGKERGACAWTWGGFGVWVWVWAWEGGSAVGSPPWMGTQHKERHWGHLAGPILHSKGGPWQCRERRGII